MTSEDSRLEIAALRASLCESEAVLVLAPRGLEPSPKHVSREK
jgi:hypothetical protein